MKLIKDKGDHWVVGWMGVDVMWFDVITMDVTMMEIVVIEMVVIVMDWCLSHHALLLAHAPYSSSTLSSSPLLSSSSSDRSWILVLWMESMQEHFPLPFPSSSYSFSILSSSSFLFLCLHYYYLPLLLQSRFHIRTLTLYSSLNW